MKKPNDLKQVSIDDLCEENIDKNILLSFSKIDLDLGLRLKNGNISIRANIDIPVNKLLLGMVVLGTLSSNVLVIKLMSLLR
jgi:hypothetical protein